VRHTLVLALVLAGACVAGCCSHAPPANNDRRGELLDAMIANMGSQAKVAGTRSVAQIASVDQDVRNAQALRALGWAK
jgi:cytochrome c556